MGFLESESWRLEAHFESLIHWSAALAPLTHWRAKNATSSDYLPSPIYVYELFFSLVFHFVFAPYCKNDLAHLQEASSSSVARVDALIFRYIAASVKSPVKFFLIRFKEWNLEFCWGSECNVLFYAPDVSEKEKLATPAVGGGGECGVNDSMSLPFPDCT